MVAHCHKVIREVAKEAAAELYETLMGDNLIYETWRKQNPGVGDVVLRKRFVAKNWGKCIDFARQTLALRLRDPNLDPKLAEDIVEVLTLDATLIRGRQNPAKLIGTIH